MVPTQRVGTHEQQRENRKDRKRNHLLNHFQLPQTERSAKLAATDAIGRHLKAIFEQGDAPTQQHDSQKPETFPVSI